MAGQGQQEAIQGRRVGPRGGPFQDGGGRRPVAEEKIGRPESRQAVPRRVGLEPRQARLEERDRPVRDRQAKPAENASVSASVWEASSTRNLVPAPVPMGGSVWKTAQ